MSQRLVILDLSNDWEVRILNVDASKRVKVVSGFIINYAESDNVYEIVSKRLTEEGLIDLPVILFPPRKLINKFLYSTPHIPEREILKIVKRTIIREKKINEDIFVSILKNGQITQNNLRRLEVLSLYSEKSYLESMLNNFKEYGIKVIRLFDEIQLMRIFMEDTKNLIKKGKAYVLVEVVNGKININIFREQFWIFNREFVFKFDDSELNDDDFSRISTEINRTFQFFKQKYRAFAIDRIMIFGSDKRVMEIKDFLLDITGLSVEMISESFSMDNILLPNTIEKKSEFLNSFGLLLFAALNYKNKELKNILPSEYIEKEYFFKRMVGLSVSSILILIIIAISVFYMENLKSGYKSQIKKLQESYSNLSNDVDLIENIKKQRADYFIKSMFLNLPLQHSYSISDFIRRLSLISNDNVELIDLDISLEGINFSFILKGIIRSENNIRAQTVFLKFFNNLKKFEDLSNINSSNLNVSSNEGGSSANIRGQKSQVYSSNNSVEMIFTITGNIEVRK